MNSADKSKHKFDSLYPRLLTASVKKRFPSLVSGTKDGDLSSSDLSFLLSFASRLSLADAKQQSAEVAGLMRRQAYDIATRVVDAVSPESRTTAVAAAELILSRLGNFPGADLLRRSSKETYTRTPAYLGLEAIARRFENTVEIQPERFTTLTDFQVVLLDTLTRRKSVSVSAPTSAGKSFTLSLDIVRRFTGRERTCVVYLVPTRALIRQVMYETIEKLNAAGLTGVPVVCVPDVEVSRRSQKGIVYVLTQERLMNLLFSAEGDDPIDVLIVDEAQEIADEGRGLILESVIFAVLHRYPQAAVFFSSPLRSNPGYLLSLFGRHQSGEFFVEHTSPVSQNLISVRKLDRRVNSAALKLHLDGAVHDIGELELGFKFRGGHMAHMAVALTRDDEVSIVYANRPSSAEETAAAIYELCPEVPEIDPRIADLIQFLQTHIHSKYRLADFLARGVAFHYGNMPQIVRARLEDLIKERLIKYVCCTSTLLQGVNLPAKNIFIENPKKGGGRPMQKGDFWNLAGRAGRLAKEFHGNVWCIFGTDWEVDPLDTDKMEEVASIFQKTMREDSAEVLQFANQPLGPADSDTNTVSEQVLSRVFVEYTLAGRLVSESPFAHSGNKAVLMELDKKCAAIRESQTLPDSVFAKNTTISPLRLEALAELLRQQQHLGDWMPRRPLSVVGYYDTMLNVFMALEQVFFQTGKNSHVYFCWLADQWMRGATLKELIANKVKRDEAREPRDISNCVRKVFEELEKTLRFRYVKYLRAYNDVFRAVAEQRGQAQLLGQLASLHLLIEYGASDDTLLGLMSFGVSRTTAILFKSAAKLRSNLTRSECAEVINTRDFNGLDIPQMCKEELLRLRRVQPHQA